VASEVEFVHRFLHRGKEPCHPALLGLDWVNPSKRGGMDGVFRGLAGLLRGIFQGQSTDGSILAFLKSTDGYVLALLKSTDGSVLALLRLPSVFSCQNSTVGEFWCTMAIMQEKQQNFLFEIECYL
jgi:hypothetical protein